MEALDAIEEVIPIEAPPKTEADELLEELIPRLDTEDEENLVRTIHSDYLAALLDRQDWETRLVEWDNMYHGRLPRKDFPWPGCSNFNVPLVMLGVETLKPRLTETILGGDPIIIAKPTEALDDKKRDVVELFMNWQIQNELDLNSLITESAHRFLIPGTVVIKVLWRTDRRKIKALRKFPLSTDTAIMLRTLFGPSLPEDFEETKTNTWEGTLKTNSAERKVKAKFKYTEKEILALVEKDELIYDGPRVELITAEDFVVPVNAGEDVQRMPFCSQRLWLYENDLRRKVQEGRFYQDRVEELVNVVKGSGKDISDDAVGVDDNRASLEGVSPGGESDVKNIQYEIIEDYRRWDIDEDGFEEEIITWTCPTLPDKLLGWDYLDNVFAHGLRPFIVGRYLPIPGRFYGISFAEVVRGIQEEINTIHNQRVDAGTIQNNPGYFYRASSTHSPVGYKLRPGEGVPIDDPSRDVLMMKWQGGEQFGQAEEALLYQYYERLTGLPDLVLGRQPNRVGATRTASGTSALLSEAGLRFRTAMRAFQSLWEKVFDHILALDAQYLAPGKEFRITGRIPETIKLVDRSELLGNFDLKLTATAETLNRQVMREDATVKLNTALSPILLQLGAIGTKGLHRLLRDFYRSYGESDPDLILEPLRDEEMVYTPTQELQIFVNGGNVEPTMMENALQHLQEHMTQLDTPIVLETLGPEGMAKLQMHLSKTLKLAQMQALAQQMMMKGGGKPSEGSQIGPQAMNAQTGQQAPQTPGPNTNMGMPGQMGMGG